jgi:hypothetical protein
MNRGSVAVFVVFLLGAGDALAQGRYGATGQGQGGSGQMSVAGLGARYRHWQPEIEGDMEAADDNIGGSSLETDMLGMDEKEQANDISVWLPNLPFLGQMHVQYFTVTWEGDGVAESAFNFSGSSFLGGTATDTEQEWQVWTILWEYGGGMPLGGMASGFSGQAGLKNIRLDTKIEGTGLGGEPVSDEAGMAFYSPVFGVAFTFPLLSFLALNIEANGTKLLGYSDVEGTLIDAAGALHVRISSFWLGVGYRWILFDVEDDSPKSADKFEMDVELKGIFFEGGVRF